MTRHLRRRLPTAGRRFTWGRIIDANTRQVTYRLFRRAITGRLFVEARTFDSLEPRADIAIRLKDMRRRMLDVVDAVDLAQLGLLETA